MALFAARVEIPRTRELLRAMRVAPDALERHLADAFDHAKRKFFSQWYKRTRVEATPRVGIINKFWGLIDRQAGNIDALALRMFTYSTVAKVHETGGTIRARGQMLRIPIKGSSVTTARKGRLKKMFRGRDLRDDPRFFTVPGTDLIFRRFGRGKRPRIEPVFALKAQVKVRARLDFFRNWNSLESWRIRRMNLAISRALSDVAKTRAA